MVSCEADKGSGRSGNDVSTGDVVSSAVSRTRAGSGSGLRAGCGSEVSADTDAPRARLVPLALMGFPEESSETGVRTEARRASLVNALIRFNDRERPLVP